MTPPRRHPRNLLSGLLARHDWTDVDLAAHTGLSRSRINRLKNRVAQPTVREGLAIAAALHHPLEEIFDCR